MSRGVRTVQGQQRQVPVPPGAPQARAGVRDGPGTVQKGHEVNANSWAYGV